MNTINLDQLNQAYEAIENAQRILVVAHQKPDGDTSGSSLALYSWLTGLNKEVTIFCRHELPQQFHFMPNFEVITTDPSLFRKDWDLVITCDSGDLAYAGVEDDLSVAAHGKLINIDHHASNKLFGSINLVNDKASSTAEVIYEFFNFHKVELTREIAVCLMTGVFTDTGGFSNGATNEQALKMASHFMRCGASLPDIHRATIANKSIAEMKLWGKIMERLRINKYGIAYTYILKADLLESGLEEDSIEGLSNYLSQLDDARAIFVFSERDEGTIKVSMRTYHNDVDLAKLATTLGGGGHKKAAGFTIPGRILHSKDSVQVVPA
jgi:bifunctional oligoribonuclease and PAP phosphatase NrnA